MKKMSQIYSYKMISFFKKIKFPSYEITMLGLIIIIEY